MKRKLKTWLKRYMPAEILGTVSAVLFPTLAVLITDNNIIIAFVGTWGENIGFYGTMIVQEVFHARKKYKEENRKYGYLAFMKSVRNIIIEFGIAESADSLLVRPATMYFTLSIFSNLQIGILAGKILADIIFYIPTVISYELRKKHLKD